MTWDSLAAAVFADEKKLKQAVALWLLVERHMQNCKHKRECREVQLAWEAEEIARKITIPKSADTKMLDELEEWLLNHPDSIELWRDPDVRLFTAGGG